MSLNENIFITTNSKNAKYVGLLFLFSLLIPTFNWVFILSKIIVTNDYLSSAENVIYNNYIFRLGIVNEILAAVVIILLALALYKLLSKISPYLSKVALVFLLVDAFITIIIALMHLTLVEMLCNSNVTSNIEQLKTLAGSLLNMHISLTSIAGMFLGISMWIFMYLFLNSKYLPKYLSVFGLLSHSMVFIYDLLFVLSPNLTSISYFQIVGLVPYILFTIIIGIYLLMKGFNGQKV